MAESKNNVLSFVSDENIIGKGGFGKVYKATGKDLESIGAPIRKRDYDKHFAVKIPNKDGNTEDIPRDCLNEIYFSSFLDDPRIVKVSFLTRPQFLMYAEYGGIDLTHFVGKSSFLKTIANRKNYTTDDKTKFNRIIIYVMYHVISIIDQFHMNYVVHADIATRNIIIDLSDYDNDIDLFIDKVIMSNDTNKWILPFIKIIDLGLTSFFGTGLTVNLYPNLDIHDLGNLIVDFFGGQFSDTMINGLLWRSVKELLDFCLTYGLPFMVLEDLYDEDKTPDNIVTAKQILKMKIFNELPYIGGKRIERIYHQPGKSKLNDDEIKSLVKDISISCSEFEYSELGYRMLVLLSEFYFQYKSTIDKKLWLISALLLASIFSRYEILEIELMNFLKLQYKTDIVIFIRNNILDDVDMNNVFQRLREMIENKEIDGYEIHKEG